jgi:hypothetical protein
MAKIDIITLTGLTASDGSMILSGATLKFNSEFFAQSNDIMIRPKIYRSRELFDLGFNQVYTDVIPDNFKLSLEDVDFYTLTPAILYEKVRDYLNVLMGAQVFEIKIIA